MANRQIQPAGNREIRLPPRGRPRGLVSQVSTSLLQPGYFFRTLPPMADTRQWLWVAVLILALTGLSAVRQDALKNGSGSNTGFTAPPIDLGSPSTDLGGGKTGGGGAIGGDFSGGGDFGGPPADFGTDTSTGTSGNISSNLTTALINAAGIIVSWIILAVLLSEVTLFNGRLPSLGQNLQVAIWTTVPIAIMAGLQLVYYAAGGGVGETGISGLLTSWKGYETLPTFAKSLVLSFATRMTLFWLWSLILIYIGGRNALEGKRWAVLIVVIVWAVVSVVVPVLTGAIAAPETVIPEDQNTSIDGNIPIEGNSPTEGTPSTEGDTPFDLGLDDPSSGLQPVMPDSTLPPGLEFLVEASPTPSGETTSEPDAGTITPESESQNIAPGGGGIAPGGGVAPGGAVTPSGNVAPGGRGETTIIGPSFDQVSPAVTPDAQPTNTPSGP